MTRTFLAATAVIISSFTPAALPVLTGTATAATAEQLAARCLEQFGALPNERWRYEGVLGGEISSTPGSTSVTGYTINPASRVIHAIVETSGSITTYQLTCNAVNPGNQIDPDHTRTNGTYTELSGGTTVDEAAVCNPATYSGPGVPETWFTPPGNAHLLGTWTCDSLYADLTGGA